MGYIVHNRPFYVAIDFLPIGLLSSGLRLLVPIYFFTLVAYGAHRQEVPTKYFFDFSTTTGGGVYVNDLIPALWDTSQVLLREDSSTLFLVTRFTNEYQEYRDYGNCTQNMTGPPTWCTLDSSGEVIGTALETQTIEVVSRIECSFGGTLGKLSSRVVGDPQNFIFSNYNRNNPKQQPKWNLTLAHDVAPFLSSNLASYYTAGTDLSVTYEWDCDLGTYGANDRYACAVASLRTRIRQLSSTSIIEKKSVIIDTDVSNYRRVLTLYGIRLRFVGQGGCFQVSVSSVLSVMAESFAVSTVGGAIMYFVSSIFLWYVKLFPIRATVTHIPPNYVSDAHSGGWMLLLPKKTAVKPKKTEKEATPGSGLRRLTTRT
jgi:hypothetical protein